VTRPSSHEYGAIIVGGGFYGCRLALMRRAAGDRVLLVERDAALLGRASLNNQARVHNGYHYPRSILTSLRSRMNYARFLEEYSECVDRSFTHYYAVARGMSKVTAAQFTEFCRRIDAPLVPAPRAVSRLFDLTRIDAVFEAQECAFDAVKLRARVTRDLERAGVEVLTNTQAECVAADRDGRMSVTVRGPDGDSAVSAGQVINCTYSRLNRLLANSGSALIPMKHELTELALVEPPAELEGAAVTVMDGPFFSLMPYPSRGLFTLSHVRYTPHCNWHDRDGAPLGDGDPLRSGRASRFAHMVHDAQRYLPAMRNTRYVESLFEIKTIMPRSEQDDSRPILLRPSAEFPRLITVLGAKIDSVYDVEEAFAKLSLAGREGASPADSLTMRVPA
jgi:glycine/D-amino acid oxidase-like deaminating enzyme